MTMVITVKSKSYKETYKVSNLMEFRKMAAQTGLCYVETYSASDFLDFVTLALLVTNVLNHVVGEETHGKVVVTADDASED